MSNREEQGISRRRLLQGAVALGGAYSLHAMGVPEVLAGGNAVEGVFNSAAAATRGAVRLGNAFPAVEPPFVWDPRSTAGTIVRRIETAGKKLVVLTFDDGPDRVHDLADANILRDRGYEGLATFFSVGINVRSNPRVTQELYERGFIIGNHVMTHGDYSVGGEAREISPAQEAIYKVIGEYPWAFRAAGGTQGQAILDVCREFGLTYIWTNNNENDSASPRISAEEMNIIFARALMPSYISLRHSGGTHDNTTNAIHGMLDIIEENDYQIVSLYDAMAYMAYLQHTRALPVQTNQFQMG